MKTEEKAKQEFKAQVLEWADKLDVKVRSTSIRSMSTKWASCSTNGRLTFDSKVPHLDPELQDYVIVHELLHFHVPNHGKLWKSLMRAHLGNYEKAEELLKELSASTAPRSEYS